MKKTRKTFTKVIGALLAALICLYNTGSDMQLLRSIPDDLYTYEDKGDSHYADYYDGRFRLVTDDDSEVALSFDQSLSQLKNNGSNSTARVRLHDIVDVKTVNLKYRESITVMPGGRCVGIHIKTDGMLVVGFGQFDTDKGYISPAKQFGLRAGDIIVEANSKNLKSASQLSEIVAQSTDSVNLLIWRDGKLKNIMVTPLADKSDGVRKLGVWIRDDTAGIGTLSMIDVSTMQYGVLGHGIKDADTGTPILAREGSLLKATILGVQKSEKGVPGEIRGTFNSSCDIIGSVEACTDYGVYGRLNSPWSNPLYPNGIQLAYPEEARVGKAQILTSVENGEVKAYNCKIVKVYNQTVCAPRGMVIEITDDELLSKTGGIVQGMSGSPLIQNGKLIGIVTHVLINEPKKGYCLYAYWMYRIIKEDYNIGMVG